MNRVVLLDAGPLGMLTNPRTNEPIAQWFKRHLVAGTEVLVPEIADYEVRRELLRANKSKSVQRLDALQDMTGYLRITTDAMRMAAQFWAEARKGGYPTAPDHVLDADVILAAQAKTCSGDSIVATTNVGHLSRFVSADNWERIAVV